MYSISCSVFSLQRHSSAYWKTLLPGARQITLNSFKRVDQRLRRGCGSCQPREFHGVSVRTICDSWCKLSLPPHRETSPRRCYSEVVLTPSTVMERLETIFPPALESPKKGTGTTHTVRNSGMLFTCASYHDPRRVPTVVPTELRACCYPIPWERVWLKRVSAVTQSVKRSKCDRNGGSGASGGEFGGAKVTITPAVYNIFIPPEFLLRGTALVGSEYGASASVSAIMEDEFTVPEGLPLLTERKHQSHVFSSDWAFLRMNKEFNAKKVRGRESKHPVWLQHIAVLHSIPGLPDPAVERLNLKTLVSQIYAHQGRGENPAGRAGASRVRRVIHDNIRHKEKKDALNRGKKKNIKSTSVTSNGGVGVWIIHPNRENIFFALRYAIGADSYEWLCPPRRTFFSQTEGQVDAGVRTTAASTFDHAQSDISFLQWARRTMCEMAHDNLFYSEHGGTMTKGSLSTILYHYAGCGALGVAERRFFVNQLVGPPTKETSQSLCSSLKAAQAAALDDDGRRVRKGSKSKRRHRGQKEHSPVTDVISFADVWAPLPRGSFLLRQRNLTHSPEALAGAMKYGLLRITY
uniref:WGS project CAEQ00000000 data, annotated contig 1850 n=1 Tax=Trypanosoma congolense (strain IL3000) TaxID=1068625 RepID=F9W9D2_TRYCI|nr:unnamed protein product [Trypanosoma congolense IL3000]